MNIIKKLTIYSFLLLIPTNAYAAPTDNLSENKVQIVADANGINPELLDKTGFPIKEVADKAERVSSKLALDLLKAKMIIEVYIDTRSNYMLLISEGGAVMLANYDPDPKLLDKLFENKITPVFGEFLASEKNTEIATEKVDKRDRWWFSLYTFLPALILIAGMVLIYEKRQRDKRVPVANDDETNYQTREGPAGSIPKVTFEDVAGCDEAIEDLAEIVEFLKNPERFEALGAKVPRGAILVGPPGTGKTLLARAVAGEAKVAFFAASGSDFVEMYVGVGAMRVRELFAKARLAEKAIVFIDEIDAVARARAMSTKQNANDERENTLNALLNELDGFNRGNVIILAATNRIDVLDPAILRPGRLDRKVQVPNPDRRGREKILSVHVAGKPLNKNVDLSLIAKRTQGMSGADLAQVANEAAIEAARKGMKNIDADCFSSAVALVVMGRARKSAIITDQDRLITAYHEAGHTICAMLEKDAPDPVSVSITPRGHAGGVTWMSGSDDQYLSRKQAYAQLIVAMGGRVGEEFLLDGEFTQGPSSDLERATQLAIMMVTKYGMSRRGISVRNGEPDSITSDVVEEILTEALDKSRKLVFENKILFLKIIDNLMEHETLEYSELLEIKLGNDIPKKIVKKNKKNNILGKVNKAVVSVSKNISNQGNLNNKINKLKPAKKSASKKSKTLPVKDKIIKDKKSKGKIKSFN